MRMVPKVLKIEKDFLKISSFFIIIEEMNNRIMFNKSQSEWHHLASHGCGNTRKCKTDKYNKNENGFKTMKTITKNLFMTLCSMIVHSFPAHFEL